MAFFSTQMNSRVVLCFVQFHCLVVATAISHLSCSVYSWKLTHAQTRGCGGVCMQKCILVSRSVFHSIWRCYWLRVVYLKVYEKWWWLAILLRRPTVWLDKWGNSLCCLRSINLAPVPFGVENLRLLLWNSKFRKLNFLVWILEPYYQFYVSFGSWTKCPNHRSLS